jgi:hypothetical protein
MNRYFRMGLMFVVLAAGGTAAAYAHHSVAGVFDVSKSVKLSGTISRVDWINPHTQVYLDVKEANGTITTWKLESLPVAMMRKAGLTSQMIVGGGQHVVADVNPARNGPPGIGYILNLTYDDGRHYQFGSVPSEK